MCLFCRTQGKIFWRKFVTGLFWGTIDSHSRWKILWSRTALFPTFSRISSFVFRTNTFIQVWKYLRLSKWWLDYHLWVNYPFKNRKAGLDFGLIKPRLIYTKLMGRESMVKEINSLQSKAHHINCQPWGSSVMHGHVWLPMERLAGVYWWCNWWQK